jgi:membrane dipeptidase
MSDLHDDLLVIDGLIFARWDRSVYADMRRGGITAANCTVSVWEGFQATMNNIGAFKRDIRDHSDLLMQVYSVDDILHAKETGRTGIILGFQNVSAFEDRLDYIGLFKELGVGIAQIAYNTQNLVGTGCYETRDGGLSDFGQEVIAEMNRLGILCDLSHVGPKTSEDVIKASKKPCAYTHCAPAARPPK